MSLRRFYSQITPVNPAHNPLPQHSVTNPSKISLSSQIPRLVTAGLILLAGAGFLTALLLEKPWNIVAEVGREFSVAYCAATSGWYGLVMGGMGFLLLGLTAKWWLRPQPCASAASEPRAPKWFWPVVLCAVCFSAAFNAPRLSAGFWDDEEYSMRRSIAGTFRQTGDGDVKFKPVPWRDTFFYYQKPNNHILNSVFARLSNSVWRAVARPEGLPYSEVAVRLPALLAGLGGIVAAACLLKLLGLPAAGVLAAWLLALHPWQARFTPEVRGYAYLFLLIPLACLLAIKALRSGQWRWWLASGLCQFAMVAAWAGSLVFLCLLNVGVLALALTSKNRLSNVVRFVVSSCLAGLLALLLYAPCVPQFSSYSQSMGFMAIELRWIANVAARFVTGLSWKVTLSDSHPSASAMLEASPILGGVVAGLALCGILFGTLRMVSSGRERAWLVPVLLLPSVVLTGMAFVKKVHLFEWYVVGALPGFVCLTAVGLAWMFARLTGRRTRLAAGLGILACAAFGFFNAGSLRTLWERPICPIREAVLLTRPNLNPYDPVQKQILTAFIFGPPHVYDPHAQNIKKQEDLLALMQESTSQGKPLFINQSYTAAAAQKHPDVTAMLLDPTLFEQIHLSGIEPMFDRDVFRYLGGQ